jgi:sterol desaturase/sphingolipid hydroxylase (fatty acid hydroxylase superfamily)
MIAVLGSAVVNLAVLAAIFVPLERTFPARRWQRIVRPKLVVDACFFFGGYLVTATIALAVLHGIDHVVRGRLPALAHVSIAWALSAPTMPTMPTVVQVVVAVVLGDLVVYWFHRACHRFDFLWRFHAVHHSSEHLDWLAAHREHPFDGVATQICMNFPAIALGVPVRHLAGIAVLRGVWAVFVHSNVRLPLGPLKWILGAPELHHWHHAKLEGESRVVHNYANLAPYLDWIFGTHFDSSVLGEERFPLGIDERIGESWIALVLSPFRPRPASQRPLLLPKGVDEDRAPHAVEALVVRVAEDDHAHALVDRAREPGLEAG